MKRSAIRLIVILGAISVIGIVIMQVYWMQKTFNIKERQFHQSVNSALRNVANILFDYNNEIYDESCDLPYDNPVVRVSDDYYIVNVNCEIEADILKHYLISEFENRDLTVDFEYAIYDCLEDKMKYGDYISFNKDTTKIFRKTELEKCGEFIYYFGVYFPDHNSFIRGNMDVWYFFSLLMLLILIFFTYSLFVILKQRRLTEVQKDFINNMTHEFKTPISSIAISADVLLEDTIVQEPDRINKYAGIIKDQNLRLKTQVEKVLKMAAIDKNKFLLNKKEIDINEKLDKIISEFKSSIDNKSYLIESQFLNKEIIVSLDELHFSNLIFNILDNAIKYCKTDALIKVSTNLADNKFVISISDNGIGIKKEHQKRIFQTFYRVPTGNIHDVKGFGLGLSYVLKIVKAHKWKIKVESQIENGSTFKIFIPIKKVKTL